MSEIPTPIESSKDSSFTPDMFDIVQDKVVITDQLAVDKTLELEWPLKELVAQDPTASGNNGEAGKSSLFYAGDSIVRIELEAGPKIGGQSESRVTVYELPPEGRSNNAMQDLSRSQHSVEIIFNPFSSSRYRLAANGYEDQEKALAVATALGILSDVAAQPPFTEA
jgi:hypothetical protein